MEVAVGINRVVSIGYINSNEPKRVKRAFEDILDPYPLAEFDKGEFDMLLFTKAGAVAIERKKIPQDLLSSIDDGRLSRELVAHSPKIHPSS